MKLFEAIIDANHRAAAGDNSAGLRPAEYAAALPIVALTCVDARLNPLLPEVLGIPEEQFIWLRNAGNVITGPMSSTMRSLSLACAVKGGKEIAVIGHTDCQVGRTTTMQLLDKLKALGIERNLLPENINEFFGVFGSDRQNVIKGCEIVRHSPLIGPNIPVHGLLVDIQTGKLEWLVNGYEKWATMKDRLHDAVRSAEQAVDAFKSLTDFKIGDMKFPETKIGETVVRTQDWLAKKLDMLGDKLETPPPAAAPPVTPPPAAPPPARSPTPPRLPLPPPIRPRMHMRPRDK
jgi:carbonic anhydrase